MKLIFGAVVFLTTAVYGLFGLASKQYVDDKVSNLPTIQTEAPLGASIPVVVSLFETSLQAGISTSDTSMTLVSGTDRAGNTLSGYSCFTIDEGTSSAEFVCGSASSTAITSMIRGISPTTGTSSVTSLKFQHRRGASVKITNYPQLAIVSRILNGNETLPNVITFDSAVASTSIASNLQNVASVEYVNGVALSGAPNATTTTKGIIQTATGAQISIGTLFGSTGAVLVPGGNLFSSTSSATILVPVTKANGKLAQGFLDLTETFNFTSTTTLAATTTARLVIDNVSYVFPNTQGIASSTLTNDGSGRLYWGRQNFSFATTTTSFASTTWSAGSASTTLASFNYTPPVSQRLMAIATVSAITAGSAGQGCSLHLYIDGVDQGDLARGVPGANGQFEFNLGFTFTTPVQTAVQHTYTLGGVNVSAGGCATTGQNSFTIQNIGN